LGDSFEASQFSLNLFQPDKHWTRHIPLYSSRYCQPEDQKHEENDNKNVEEYASHVGSRDRDPRETENSRNDGNEEKYQRPFQQ
jgi:hypothetical protein